ncbi:MAG: DUF1840 domain-containing protein [Steroidobacteraceae bacterium]
MLVRFKSIETDPITMFGDVATQLIKMLGATGNVPGAISAEDVPAALQRLRQQLQNTAAQALSFDQANFDQPSEDKDEHEKREPPITLATRAAPLIDLLQRAAAGKAPVMWEAL